jgi:L-amino acid N-acyltransferase YncA
MTSMQEATEVCIERMAAEDWPAVRAIYVEGIATGHATFEKSTPEWEVWDRGHLSECRFVARSSSEVIGWAAASPVSGRCVYVGVAEVSLYVAASMRGRKIGTRLLTRLIEESEALGIWTLQAGIFPENIASVQTHKRCGFRVVGVREKLGRMDGVWRDVLLLERRSRVL